MHRLYGDVLMTKELLERVWVAWLDGAQIPQEYLDIVLGDQTVVITCSS